MYVCTPAHFSRNYNTRGRTRVAAAASATGASRSLTVAARVSRARSSRKARVARAWRGVGTEGTLGTMGRSVEKGCGWLWESAFFLKIMWMGNFVFLFRYSVMWWRLLRLLGFIQVLDIDENFFWNVCETIQKHCLNNYFVLTGDDVLKNAFIMRKVV